MDDELRERLAYPPRFRDRAGAGAALAVALGRYRGKDVLVLGIPRGGVAVAAEVARRLDADLDVVVARKLGSPISSELAIGAVTANGGRYLNEQIIDQLGVTGAYLERVTAQEIEAARRREERFRGARSRARIEGRVAIVVDDGIATGATMRAALRSVRQARPARLVMAVPVAPLGTSEAFADEVDEVVCLYELEPFWAVGLYYQNFAPTEDLEVRQLLHARQVARRSPASS